MENIFKKEVSNKIIERINKLTPETKANWGTMNVGQMLAHMNVAYEMVYTEKHKKPKGLLKFILKTFIKNKVVSEKPFVKNGRTAPAFLITEEKDFEKERTRLIEYLNKTQELGESYFEGKESHSFGKLSSAEWNSMFMKHIDHHLNQFGV